MPPSEEVRVESQILLHELAPISLTEIKALACQSCKHTLPMGIKRLREHFVKTHELGLLPTASAQQLTPELRRLALSHGGLTQQSAWAIPHGQHYYLSLTLRLNGIACRISSCGWVGAMPSNSTTPLDEAKRHLNTYHDIRLTESEYQRTNLIFPLPVQCIERLEGATKVYFITRNPLEFTTSRDEASD